MSKILILLQRCRWWRPYGPTSRSRSSIISSLHNNVVKLHSRFCIVLETWDYIRVQQPVLKCDLNSDSRAIPSMKGALTRNAICWMKNYFKLNCEVMPTTSTLHLSDNYTRREVYDAYRSDMLTTSDKYVTYSQFTRLWSTQFTNVVIPRRVCMGYCSICANLKRMAKGAKITKEKDIYKKSL